MHNLSAEVTMATKIELNTFKSYLGGKMNNKVINIILDRKRQY